MLSLRRHTGYFFQGKISITQQQPCLEVPYIMSTIDELPTGHRGYTMKRILQYQMCFTFSHRIQHPYCWSGHNRNLGCICRTYMQTILFPMAPLLRRVKDFWTRRLHHNHCSFRVLVKDLEGDGRAMLTLSKDNSTRKEDIRTAIQPWQGCCPSKRV